MGTVMQEVYSLYLELKEQERKRLLLTETARRKVLEIQKKREAIETSIALLKEAKDGRF